MKTINKLLCTVTFSFLSVCALSGCGNKKTSSTSLKNQFNITYHYRNEETEVVKVDEGTTFTPKTAKEYENYSFYSYFYDESYKLELNSTELVADKNYDIYALYSENGYHFVTYYNDSNDPKDLYRDTVKEGDRYEVKGDIFDKEGYYVINWSRSKSTQERCLTPHSYTNVSEHLKLYPNYNAIYVGTDNEGNSYSIKVYPDNIGLGSAYIIVDGVEKAGFYNKESGEFEFMFGTDDIYSLDEDISGVITGDGTAIFCNNKERGMYVLYDYLTGKTSNSTILYLDGYGKGILALYDGTGIQADIYGEYKKTDYGDYELKEIDPETNKFTGQHFYFNFTKTSSGTESFNGTFMICGEEEGGYLSFNGYEIGTDTLLTLNGYGGATLQTGYDSKTQTFASTIEGRYIATSNYESSSGEYKFISNDNKTTILFCLYQIQSTNGENYWVYVTYNEQLSGTYFKNESSTYPYLYFDGYLGVIFYLNDIDYLTGEVLYHGNEAICYLYDENNNVSIMRFVLDFVNKTYSFNDNGFVIVDNVLLRYEGYSTVIEIPEGVTSIADDAFNYLHTAVEVLEVTIPSTVTSIGERAFENNGTLKYVRFAGEIPPVIKSTSFRWPGGQFKMIVPDGCVSAYKNAEVYKDKYAQYIVSVTEFENRPLFEIEGDTLIRFNPKDGDDISNIKIPDGIKKIANNCFKQIQGIKSVDFNEVETIGNQAFLGCMDLKSISAPNVKEIGNDAFVECVSLNNVELPEIINIGSGAFASCYGLNKVTIGEHAKSIGDEAFSQCSITVKYEGEDEILEGNLFYITFLGKLPPSMGSKVFYGTTVKIIVDSFDTALSYYNNGAGWGNYFKHFFIESGEERGDYVDVTNLLGVKVDGRMELYEYMVLFYKIEGNKVYVYSLDDGILSLIENVTYSTEEGFNFANQTKFVRKGSTVTYTNGEETLVVNTDYSRDGYKYLYAADFNGTAITLTVDNSSITASIGYTKYSFSLSMDKLGNLTFTYTKSTLTHTETYTCSDGSIVQITFNNASITIIGALKSINRGDGNPLSTEIGWYAFLNKDTGAYEFTASYLANKFQVSMKLNEENNTFTYTSEKLTQINCKTIGNDIIQASVNSNNEVKGITIMFRNADNTLSNANCEFEYQDGYYICYVDFEEEYIDQDSLSITRGPSPRNGVYKVTLNLTAKTATMVKM